MSSLLALPPAEEIAAALRAVDHAVVALGTLDFDGLARRTFAGLEAERDVEPDNDADSTASVRNAQAHLLAAAGAFRLMAGAVARIRAAEQESSR